MERPDFQTWGNQRYYPISAYYNNKYGGKTFKVSVSVATSCPNRRGTNGMETCIFCDEYGSAAYHTERNLSLRQQIEVNKAKISRRYKANKFLVYFQSYTNTFAKVDRLRGMLEAACEHEGVVGLVIGTRPDCLPKNMLKMLSQVGERTSVEIELGLQTFNEEQLLFIKRGHTALCGIEAIRKLKEHTNADVGVHLIFGIPGENFGQLEKTANIINSLPVDTVKLHNLHVLKNTGLVRLYREGKFQPLELPEYGQRVVFFLERLSPRVAVHRLAATANRHDELIAPEWTKERMRPIQHILNQLQTANTWQGRHCQT